MTTEGRHLPAVDSAITLEVGVGQNRKVYASRVKSIGFDTAIVAMPSNWGVPAAIQPGSHVRVVYANDTGVYGIMAEVAGQQMEPIPVLILVNLGNVKRMQRRHYLRVATTLFPMESHLLGPDSARCRPIRMVIVNIGGGGMRFAGDEYLPVGSMVWVRIDLPLNCGVADAVLTVLRVKERPNQVRSCFETSGWFSTVSERDRDRICKYAARQQLELVKRRYLWE